MIPDYKQSCHKIKLDMRQDTWCTILGKFKLNPYERICPFCKNVLRVNWDLAFVECKKCDWYVAVELPPEGVPVEPDTKYHMFAFGDIW